jgi:HTH-type transcriptional regulator/antitoxin HigA
MQLCPIHNDHGQAMVEIERLWGAPEGSPEAEQLDVLVTLLNAYEVEHHPIDPPDPIEATAEQAPRSCRCSISLR